MMDWVEYGRTILKQEGHDDWSFRLDIEALPSLCIHHNKRIWLAKVHQDDIFYIIHEIAHIPFLDLNEGDLGHHRKWAAEFYRLLVTYVVPQLPGEGERCPYCGARYWVKRGNVRCCTTCNRKWIDPDECSECGGDGLVGSVGFMTECPSCGPGCAAPQDGLVVALVGATKSVQGLVDDLPASLDIECPRYHGIQCTGDKCSYWDTEKGCTWEPTDGPEPPKTIPKVVIDEFKDDEAALLKEHLEREAEPPLNPPLSESPWSKEHPSPAALIPGAIKHPIQCCRECVSFHRSIVTRFTSLSDPDAPNDGCVCKCHDPSTPEGAALTKHFDSLDLQDEVDKVEGSPETAAVPPKGDGPKRDLSPEAGEGAPPGSEGSREQQVTNHPLNCPGVYEHGDDAACSTCPVDPCPYGAGPNLMYKEPWICPHREGCIYFEQRRCHGQVEGFCIYDEGHPPAKPDRGCHGGPDLQPEYHLEDEPDDMIGRGGTDPQ